MNTSTTAQQTRALTSIALFAAFSDGAKSDAERVRVQQLVESVGEASVTDALRAVMNNQTTLEAEAKHLDTPELRQLAWEGALGVCEVDGVTTAAERAFLNDLAAKLGRPKAEAADQIDLLDDVIAGSAAAATPATLAALHAAPLPSGSLSPAAADPRAAQTDQTVLRYAILTAGLELLPQNLASMAIIPLQTKMVHSVGATYGFPLSAASIKEFAAAIGLGTAGQMVERYARRFLARLAGGLLGSVGKTAVNWGSGPAFTFATTYAMGMVAKQYYAGGRTLSAINLQTLFSDHVQQAHELYARYEPQVREAATKTNPLQLLSALRGSVVSTPSSPA